MNEGEIRKEKWEGKQNDGGVMITKHIIHRMMTQNSDVHDDKLTSNQ